MGAPINGTSKVIEYAHLFYNALSERSEQEKFPIANPDGTSESIEGLVFRGSLTEVFRSLGLSQTYYTKIRKVFKEHGCTRLLQQGTRGVQTVLLLNHAPPAGAIPPAEPLTTRPTFDKLTHRIERVEARLDAATGGINIADALRDMERRLAKLEAAAKNGR